MQHDIVKNAIPFYKSVYQKTCGCLIFCIHNHYLATNILSDIMTGIAMSYSKVELLNKCHAVRHQLS